MISDSAVRVIPIPQSRNRATHLGSFSRIRKCYVEIKWLHLGTQNPLDGKQNDSRLIMSRTLRQPRSLTCRENTLYNTLMSRTTRHTKVMIRTERLSGIGEASPPASSSALCIRVRSGSPASNLCNLLSCDSGSQIVRIIQSTYRARLSPSYPSPTPFPWLVPGVCLWWTPHPLSPKYYSSSRSLRKDSS